jgi:NADH-quinone oxidoreductase subunit J
MTFSTFMFYFFAAVLVFAALRVITARNPVHAALFLVLAFFTSSGLWIQLEAEFLAIALVLVYVGAVMVLFLFVVMMLNIGRHAADSERRWLTPGIWIGPVILASILIVEVAYVARAASPGLGTAATGPKEVGIALFGPYAIGVALASMLLMAGLVGAYHLGLRKSELPEKRHDTVADEGRVGTGGSLVLAGTDRSARTT